MEEGNVQESGHHPFRNQGGDLKNGQDDDERCSGSEMEKEKKVGDQDQEELRGERGTWFNDHDCDDDEDEDDRETRNESGSTMEQRGRSV